MKIVVIRYDAEILTALLPFLMTVATPQTDAPAAEVIKKVKKSPAPLCLGEVEAIFMIRVRPQSIHARFYSAD